MWARLLSLCLAAGPALAGPPEIQTLEGDISPIHDPAIIRERGSFDMCCRGKDSTYRTMVGRAKRITGPYMDKDGRPMMEGGGTLVIQGADAWRGPGHVAVLFDSEADLLVFHAYDGTTGRPSLQISTMIWEDGWPRAGRLR